MPKYFVVWIVCFFVASASQAADLLISNARLIDGLGGERADTSVLIADGVIESIGDDREPPADATVIDAAGMTLMPGLINSHWHLFAGSAAGSEAELDAHVDNAVIPTLEALLERGITTIMSPGDHFPRILSIRQDLKQGRIRGPRLLAVGPVFTSPNDWPTQICGENEGCNSRLNAVVTTPDESRARVRELAEAGVDAIKLVYDDVIAPNARIADDLVAAIAEEAHRNGLRLFVHPSASGVAASALLALGTDAFVHVPQVIDGSIEEMSDRRIPVSTTVATWLSTAERPMATDVGYEFQSDAAVTTILDNIHILNQAGVPVAFGTDAVAGPRGLPAGFFPSTASGEGLFIAELHLLNRVLSNMDVIRSLTINAAEYLGMAEEIGSVEPGKVADLILIDGDPLRDIGDLEKVRLVVQAGVVVVDRR